jgi:hypothetical protein
METWKHEFYFGNRHPLISSGLFMTNSQPNRVRMTKQSQSVFELLADTYNNLEDWFNLLTSSTLNDPIVLSEKALEKVIEFFKQGSDGGGISLPYVYFYYINALSDVGQYDLAFKKFKLLTEYYVLVKITDTHFLHMRGIPFFQNTLSLGKKYSSM